MDDSQVRRSGRRRVRPVEFWNFEKPEDSTCGTITYNEIELTRCSVFKPLSLSYYQGSPANTTAIAGKRPRPAKTFKKTNSTAILKKSLEGTTVSKRKENSLIGRNSTLKRSTEVTALPKNKENSLIGRNSTLKRSTEVTAVSKHKENSLIGRNSTLKKSAEVTALSKTVENSPVNRNSGSLRQRGRKRKLDYSETDEGVPLLNGEDHSISPKSSNKKGNISAQKSPGTARRQSLLIGRKSGSSPGLRKKKEREGNKRSPRKAADSSLHSRMRSRKAGKAENNDSNKGDVSAAPSESQSNFCGSFFNDSDRQHSKSHIAGKNTTALEQPSFRNIFSSTAIDASGSAVFKVPRLPSRRHITPLKVTSYSVEPSMATIPEEEEQCESKGEEGQERMDVEKEQQIQEGDATTTATATATTTAAATATASPRKRRRSQKGHTTLPAAAPQGHKEEEETRGQDTVQGAAETVRRSSRVRTGRLEFWNFEKVQVERQEDGEVKVIHHKQDSNMHIQTRVIDCSAVVGSRPGLGITLTDNLLKAEESTAGSSKPDKPSKRPSKASSIATHPALSPKQMKRNMKALSKWSPKSSSAKSPSKRRLFSPNLNYFDESAEEEPRMSRISVGGMKVTVVGTVKFNNLHFVILEKKDYRCYLARGMHNKDKTVFISYVFLERGNIVWHSQARTTMYVMEGRGILQLINEEEAQHLHLKPKHTVHCPKQSKICVKKDGRCKMLKLHICLVREPGDSVKAADLC